MASRAALRPLAFALVLASLVPAPAQAAAWQARDVEAAERYRALERERALRYRAALEERAGGRTEPARRSAARARPERQETPRRDAAEGPRALFEPWVERLAARVWDAILEALAKVASSTWYELRAWLEASFAGVDGEAGRAQGDWRSRR
jgi:hypothetical protein